MEEIQNSKELIDDYDDVYNKEEEKDLKSLPELNERDVHEKLHIYDSYPNKTNDYDDEDDKKEEKNFKSLPELNERDVFEKLDFSSCDSNQKTDGMVTIPSSKNPNILNDFLIMIIFFDLYLSQTH